MAVNGRQSKEKAQKAGTFWISTVHYDTFLTYLGEWVPASLQ